MISSLLLVGTIVVLSLPCAIVLLPLAFLTGNPNPLYNVSQSIVRIAFSVGGIRVEVSGLDRVPAHTACIFMANHISNLDPPCLLPNIPGRTSVFIKRSLMRLPILGWAFKIAEFIPVDRGGNRQSAQDSVDIARRILAEGLHITTFVEGTRSPDGRMLPFKKGPFYLAFETGAPCIPVSIWGTESMMAKGSAIVRPGTAHITFHAPLYPRDFGTREELLDAVRNAVAEGLPTWMRS